MFRYQNIIRTTPFVTTYTNTVINTATRLSTFATKGSLKTNQFVSSSQLPHQSFSQRQISTSTIQKYQLNNNFNNKNTNNFNTIRTTQKRTNTTNNTTTTTTTNNNNNNTTIDATKQSIPEAVTAAENDAALAAMNAKNAQEGLAQIESRAIAANNVATPTNAIEASAKRAEIEALQKLSPEEYKQYMRDQLFKQARMDQQSYEREYKDNVRKQVYEEVMKAQSKKTKTSPYTSLPFITLVFIFPTAFLGWRAYADPAWMKLKILTLRRLYIWCTRPSHAKLYQYFNDSSDTTVMMECNLTDPEEMPQNIANAQRILLKELGKAYSYISYLEDFRRDLGNIMSIPGFVNNREAELQSRNMKANKSDMEEVINGVILSLINILTRIEFKHLISANNVDKEYREEFIQILCEQERIRLIDEYKVEAYRMSHRKLEERRDHTGVVITPRQRPDGTTGKSTSDQSESFVYDGDEGTLGKPDVFVPKVYEHMTKEQQHIETRLQQGVHKAQRSLAELGDKHIKQRAALEVMTQEGYISSRVVPEILEIKSIDKYSKYELELAFFYSVQAACVTVQTVAQILEVFIHAVNDQRDKILERKRKFEKQEQDTQIFNQRRKDSIKSQNFFQDNTLPQQNTPPEERITQYDFTFDVMSLTRYVDREMLPAMFKDVSRSLMRFWRHNSTYTHDKDSIKKAIEQFPSAKSRILSRAKITEEELNALPSLNMIGRLVSFPRINLSPINGGNGNGNGNGEDNGQEKNNSLPNNKKQFKFTQLTKLQPKDGEKLIQQITSLPTVERLPTEIPTLSIQRQVESESESPSTTTTTSTDTDTNTTSKLSSSPTETITKATPEALEAVLQATVADKIEHEKAQV